MFWNIKIFFYIIKNKIRDNSGLYMNNAPVGTRGLSRECVLRIPMHVVKGD